MATNCSHEGLAGKSGYCYQCRHIAIAPVNISKRDHEQTGVKGTSPTYKRQERNSSDWFSLQLVVKILVIGLFVKGALPHPGEYIFRVLGGGFPGTLADLPTVGLIHWLGAATWYGTGVGLWLALSLGVMALVFNVAGRLRGDGKSAVAR